MAAASLAQNVWRLPHWCKMCGGCLTGAKCVAAASLVRIVWRLPHWCKMCGGCLTGAKCVAAASLGQTPSTQQHTGLTLPYPSKRMLPAACPCPHPLQPTLHSPPLGCCAASWQASDAAWQKDHVTRAYPCALLPALSLTHTYAHTRTHTCFHTHTMLCVVFRTPPCLPFFDFGCKPVWLQLSCPHLEDKTLLPNLTHTHTHTHARALTHTHARALTHTDARTLWHVPLACCTASW